jgi:ClpP class serine protease
MKLTLERRPRKFVAVDGDALLKVGASTVLAIEEAALGGQVSLLADAPDDEPAQNDVAIVRVEGPLAQRAVADLCAYVDGYDAITARLGAALSRKDAAAVLLVIDSPGGDVAGLEEAVARMRSLRDGSDKPIVAYVDELAASAAYWIAASVADEVHVPGAGRVGSIGCIGAWVDQSKAWEQKGIAWHVVRDPSGKAEMMPAAPVAEVAEKRLAESVHGAAGRFYSAIATARGLDASAVRALNGALLTGRSAVDQKLADHVGTLEGAASRALELAHTRRAKRSKGNQMKLTAMVAALCGLSADASPEAAEVALSEVSKDILEGTGTKTLKGAVGAIESLKTAKEALEEKASKFDALASQVEADRKTREDAELSALADRLSAEGRLTPAKREDFIAKAKKHGIEWARDTGEMLPVQGSAPGSSIQTRSTESPVLDAALKAALAKAGMTEDDYRAAAAAGHV